MSGRTGADHSAIERKNVGGSGTSRSWVTTCTSTLRQPCSIRVAAQPPGVPSAALARAVGNAIPGTACRMASPTSRLRRGPSSLQLVTAMRPSVRVTRVISRRPAATSGKKVTPKIDAATEKRRRSRSSRCPSITAVRTEPARPAGTCVRSASSIPAAKSVASTFAPRAAARIANAPEPAATSRTSSSGPMPRSSTASAANAPVNGPNACAYCCAPGFQPAGVCSSVSSVIAASGRRTRCPRDRRAPPRRPRGPGRRRSGSRRAR